MRVVFDVTKYVNEATSVALVNGRSKKANGFAFIFLRRLWWLRATCLPVVKHRRGNAWADTAIHFVGLFISPAQKDHKFLVISSIYANCYMPKDRKTFPFANLYNITKNDFPFRWLVGPGSGYASHETRLNANEKGLIKHIIYALS